MDISGEVKFRITSLIKKCSECLVYLVCPFYGPNSLLSMCYDCFAAIHHTHHLKHARSQTISFENFIYSNKHCP